MLHQEVCVQWMDEDVKYIVKGHGRDVYLRMCVFIFVKFQGTSSKFSLLLICGVTTKGILSI